MSTSKTERISGLDIIRIVSMFLVILVHFLGMGGVIAAVQSPALKTVFCMIQGVSLCCVNLFALSTGFLHYGRKPHISSLFQLCLQGFFWITAATLAFAIIQKDMTIFESNFKDCIHLLSKRQYWYLTDYAVLFFLIPLLNAAVEKLSLKNLTFVISGIFFAVSLFPTVFPYVDPVSRGYSAVWLAVMYVIGAYIKKYDIINKLKVLPCFLVFVIFAALEGTYSLLSYNLGNGLKDYYYKFTSYNCVFVVGASIMLFIILAQINIKSGGVKNVLKAVSSVAFSVYLIHCAPLIFDNYIVSKMSFVSSHGFFGSIAMLLGSAAAVFAAGTVLGLLQDGLFRLIRIPKFFRFIENKINLCYDSVYKRFFA